jgi:hypothetical protein
MGWSQTQLNLRLSAPLVHASWWGWSLLRETNRTQSSENLWSWTPTTPPSNPAVEDFAHWTISSSLSELYHIYSYGKARGDSIWTNKIDISKQRRWLLNPGDRSLGTCLNAPDRCLEAYLQGYCTDDYKTSVNVHAPCLSSIWRYWGTVIIR